MPEPGQKIDAFTVHRKEKNLHLLLQTALLYDVHSYEFVLTCTFSLIFLIISFPLQSFSLNVVVYLFLL